MADKSEQVTKTGDYSIRIAEESSDEIGHLSSGFNRMLKQIQYREAELDSARDQLQTVLDAVPGTISWIDSDLNYLGVNRKLAEIFKMKGSEFVGKQIGFRGSSPEFVDFVKAFFSSDKKHVFKEINSVVNEKNLTHLIIGQKYAHNKAAVFIGIDITRIKEAEKAIKVSEERFSLVLEASNTGIWDFDVLNKTAYYSPRWKSLLGYLEEEVGNTSEEWEDRLHPDEKERVIKQFDDYLLNPQGHFSLDYRFKHKNGSYRWVHDRSLALTDEHGKTYRMLGSISDITERKKTEDALEEQYDLLRTIIDILPVNIFVKDPDCKFIIGNENLAKHHGVTSPEEFFGKTDFDLYPYEEAERYQTFERHLMDSKESEINIIGEHIDKNGNKEWNRNSKIPIYDHEGNSIGIVGFSQNITDIKKSEEEVQKLNVELEKRVVERTHKLEEKKRELEQANVRLQELDQLKSMFLASMSHELRTPLNSIIGFTGLLLMGMAGDLNDEQKKQLGLVKNSAQHLLELINDILDISKIEAGKIDLDINKFNLKQLINEIIEETSPLVKKKDIQLTGKASDNIYITSDKRRVKQVLMNLVSNAIKFTEIGSIQIKAETKSDDILELTVTDKGIGILKEDLGKLFAPFQQLDMSSTKKYEGTGLGLYLSKKLVTMLGGDITAKSEYGKGSDFTVNLPLKYVEKRIQ